MKNLQDFLIPLREYFNNCEDIRIAILYGSAAKGTINPLSDLDIAVIFSNALSRREMGERQTEITVDIMGLCMQNNIDITILNLASPLLAYQAIKYGNVLKCIDGNEFCDLTEKTIREFLDIKPMYDYYARVAIDNLRR